MTTCTFAGHREVYAAYLDAKLEQAIADILLTDTKFVFYTGGMGEFDARCAAAVRTAKRRNPQLDIQLCLVLPYLIQKINEDKDYYEHAFDRIIVPFELAEVHHKAAITKRNRWMVDSSDYLIAFVYRDFGGAYATLKYANQCGKKIIRLADSHI